MHAYLLIFEFLGTTEMLVIAVVALIIFGPRRIPEIGRTVGRTLSDFRRASEDFKRTWEREVEVESIESGLRVDREVNAVLSDVNDAVAASVSRDEAVALPIEVAAQEPKAGGQSAPETDAPSPTDEQVSTGAREQA